MSTATAAQTITFELPDLKDGELYIVSVITPESREHLVLLPGDMEGASHQAQSQWAQSIGGELPDRAESALLFKYAKDQFKDRAYWTREVDAEVPDYAWYQYFSDGYQGWDGTDGTLRARAVRRISF